jgi:hypothetical protein
MAEPTAKQIARFLKIRAKSPHNSNLQFAFDCTTAGFKGSDLPKAEKVEDGVYVWALSWGFMIEAYGRLSTATGCSKESAIETAKLLAFA